LLLASALLLGYPTVAHGQAFEFYSSVGPTIPDAGFSLAAGVGFSPTSRFTLLASFECTHIAGQTRRDSRVVSHTRGGTYLLGSGELRFVPLGRDRMGPFVLAGFAAGVSRPNVNEIFPTPVTNGARAVFGGGGLLVPLGARVSAFVDARMLLGAEGTEGIVAVIPVRAGMAWRF